LPKEAYPYPPDNTTTVGVPISKEYQLVNDKLQAQYRQELGLDKFEHIIFVTGGGNGARQLNSVIVASSVKLLECYPALAIVHLSGRALEAETSDAYRAILPAEAFGRVVVKGFVPDLYRYSGAADIIISRGSATNLAEFAVQAKPCVIVPARQLAWTVKNTEALVKTGSVIALDEDKLLIDPSRLVTVCESLLDNEAKRGELSQKLHALAHPNAARELAQLIVNTVS
jgi:UDP-N-acetylglucosamine:LPS N-acetylglucosamine transferase